MENKTELITVKRNTSSLTTQVLTHPVSALIGDTIPIGTSQMSFDLSDDATQQRIEDAEDKAEYEPDEYTGKPFNLTAWFCKRTEMQNESTGQMVPAVRTVLFNDNGETMSFMSIGILLSLDLIRTFKGDGPYNPPQQVFFKRIKTGSGFYIWKMKTWRGNSDSAS